MNRIVSFFPGSVATNTVVLLFGLILALCAFIPGMPGTTGSYLAGLGSAMFVAGFLGVINVRVLANEVCKVTSQPFEDYALLSQIRGSGIEEIFRDRAKILEKIIPALDVENKEIVIVGSSLKGIIGVGYNAVGQDQRIRDSLFNALKRGCNINMLLTNPMVAHHRSKQEGRLDGDIESEILENLMYFIKLRHDNDGISDKLSITLYDGTPTIFLLCTTNMMLMNPYPYYSTAYGSFAFLIKGDSDLYRGYFESHYQRAWNDTRLSIIIKNNTEEAKKQIRDLIEGVNPHGRKIIPDPRRQDELINALDYIRL